MRKTGASFDVIEPAQKRGWRLSRIASVLVMLLAAPVLFDCARLLVARWQALLGPSYRVTTPSLDFARGLFRELIHTGGRAMTGWTHRLPWPVDYAVIGLLACALLSVAFLKRGR
jgi:hypothetical protein